MSEPSFLLSYWRPWNDDSNLVDSWGDYLRNTELVQHGVDRIGEKIQRAAQDQIYAVEQAAKMQVLANTKIAEVQVQAIQKAATMIGYQLQDVNKELDFLNRRMDIVIEQQRVGLMLQDNIAQLLKIPDSEKERQQAITRGIQFFENASKDPDLFDDALEEFLKAEQMKRQDYFVLHKIGCIHLYTKKYMDVPKAMDYFLRAGKYSSVESDPSATRHANILTNSVNDNYTKQTSDPQSIKQLASDSYNKAALAAYILGDDEKSIEYQKKALSLYSTSENRFTLGKYLVRSGKISEGVNQIDSAVTKNPNMLNAILNDVDTAGEPKVIQLVERKVEEINLAMEETLERMLNENIYYKPFVSQLFEGQTYSYPERVKLVKKSSRENTIKALQLMDEQNESSPKFIIFKAVLGLQKMIEKNGLSSYGDFFLSVDSPDLIDLDIMIAPLYLVYNQSEDARKKIDALYSAPLNDHLSRLCIVVSYGYKIDNQRLTRTRPTFSFSEDYNHGRFLVHEVYIPTTEHPLRASHEIVQMLEEYGVSLSNVKLEMDTNIRFC